MTKAMKSWCCKANTNVAFVERDGFQYLLGACILCPFQINAGSCYDAFCIWVAIRLSLLDEDLGHKNIYWCLREVANIIKMDDVYFA